MNLLVHSFGVVDGSSAFGNLKVEHWFCGRFLRYGTERNIASLNHESGNEAVERCFIVCAARAEGEEVLCGLGYCFAEKLNLEVALSCMQLSSRSQHLLSLQTELHPRYDFANLP